jgi:hypothetical protein
MPIHIAPEETLQLRVRSSIDTADTNRLSLGTITVVSNSETTTADVLCTRKYVYPANIHTALSLVRARSTSGDTIALVLALESTLTDIKEFDGKLVYDQDLLTYIGYESNNSVTLTNGHLSMKNDATLEMATTLYFRVTLTTESSSKIELTSCRLNPTVPLYSDCIATISGSSTQFDYESICGDRTLSGFLRNGNIASIRSVSPNPMHGKTCEVMIYAPETMTLTIDIINMNGEIVGSCGSTQSIFAKGEHTHIVNTSDLQSGMYHIRLTDTNGIMQVKKIVEVK